MKKVWTLVAVFIVLAVLIGGYLILVNRPKTAAPVAPLQEIVNLDKEKLSKITVTSDGSVLTAVRKGEEWALDYPYPITVDQLRADELATGVTSVSAKSVVEEDPKDLSQYGLTPPQITAKAFFTDGTQKIFRVGNKTPTEDSYYFQVDGDPKVYTVWGFVKERYRFSVSDFRDKAITPAINPDEITYSRVRQRDGTIIEIKEKTTAEQLMTYLGFGAFIMTRPYSYTIGVDAEKSDAFIKAPANISIGDFVEDRPKDLSRYGLARPWGELLVRDKSNTLHLLFGADKDADNMYFMIAGAPNVYTVEKSIVSFVETKAFELADRFAFIPNIDHVDRIDISARGKTHVFTLTRTVKKAETEGEEDETVTAYTADGKSAEEDDFKKNFYQQIIGLVSEGALGKSVVGTPDLTIRYSLNTGSIKQAVVSFIPFDNNFYAISLNGKQSFAISKSQVSGVLSAVDKFLAGEAPKTE